MPDGLPMPLGAPGPSPMAGPGPALPPPPLASATPPLPPEGLRAQARVKVAAAVRQLVDALGLLKEAKSDEARAIVQALRVLGPITPEVDEGVSQSELRALVSGRPPVMPPAPTLLGTPRPVPRPLASVTPY